MVITLISPSGVKCQVGDFTLLVDPREKRRVADKKDVNDAEAPQEPARKGTIVLKTRTEYPPDTFGAPDTVWGPGEYEIAGVPVRGIAIKDEAATGELATAYSVEFEGIQIAFLGVVSGVPAEDVLDRLGEVDILSLGITDKISGKDINTLIKRIDASIILPVDDKTAEALAKELGQKISPEEKLTLKKKDIIKEEMNDKIVWLKTK